MAGVVVTAVVLLAAMVAMRGLSHPGTSRAQDTLGGTSTSTSALPSPNAAVGRDGDVPQSTPTQPPPTGAPPTTPPPDVTLSSTCSPSLTPSPRLSAPLVVQCRLPPARRRAPQGPRVWVQPEDVLLPAPVLLSLQGARLESRQPVVVAQAMSVHVDVNVGAGVGVGVGAGGDTGQWDTALAAMLTVAAHR